MAIINSYPNITPTSEDLLLISDTSVDGNPTKTATINDVLALLPSGSGGGGISNITSSNSNFLTVTNPAGPLVTLNLQTGFVSQGGNTLATTGDIYTFTNTSITNAIDNLGALTSFACDISNIPAFTSNVTTSTAGSTVLTISRTGGSNNTFLDYTGNWSTPSVQGMTSWIITADIGGTDKVEQGNEVNFVGKGKISTEFVTQSTSPVEYEILITHDSQTQTNTTPSTTLTNGGTFTALSANAGLDGDGHVTGQTLTTYTLPTVGGVNTVSVTTPVTLGGTASDPVIGVDLSSKQDAIQAVTGNGTSGVATLAVDPNTNLLTLNVPQYTGGGGGGVTSVGLNMTSNIPAFSVSNSPITTAGDLVVGIAGGPATTEYLDGSGNWSTPAGAATNLSNGVGTDSVDIFSSSGTNTDVPAATTTTAGVMTAADKTRLNQLRVTSNGTALGISPPNTSTNTLTMPWGGTSSQIVLGDGSLTTLPTQFSWTLDGNTGTPQVIADGTTVDIVGTGSVSTAINGNTLTISSTASGSGTVEEVSVGDTTFIQGTTVSGNPITSTGTLKFGLRASGTPNNTTFLNGNGNGEWKSLSISDVFQTGKGLTTDTTTAPDTVEVDYSGADNIILEATPYSAALERTDKVLINVAKQSNEVQKISIEDLLNLSGFAPATYFSVKADGTMANNGNWNLSTQGFGVITSATSGTSDIVITFANRTSTSTDYMINFTIESPDPGGGSPFATSAYVSAKTARSFKLTYTKGGTGAGLGSPQLTNFIIYD